MKFRLYVDQDDSFTIGYVDYGYLGNWIVDDKDGYVVYDLGFEECVVEEWKGEDGLGWRWERVRKVFVLCDGGLIGVGCTLDCLAIHCV